MNKTLAVDIGNTNITVGVLSGRRLLFKAKIPTHNYSEYKKYLKSVIGYGVGRVVISSVVPVALMRFVCELKKISDLKTFILGKDIKVPIKNLYRNRKEVGQDRLVNAFGARSIYGAPAVIIDFGTAITFDILSRDGSYLGGLILPGIEMGLKSLYEKTALLPRVELKPAGSIIGKDTVNSMRGGILFGYGAMCDGLLAKYKALLGPRMKVVATGGNARLIKRYSRCIKIVDEDITLKSLALIKT